MKILLIAPASGKWRHVGRHRFLNGRTFRFSLLSLLSVAAESPSDADSRIVDEQVDDIPWDADVDLVGITCMTAMAPRAYEIARRFRERRIPVVLGGIHPTLCPEEAIQCADAIVAGEAEGVALGTEVRRRDHDAPQLVEERDVARAPRAVEVHGQQLARCAHYRTCSDCGVAAVAPPPGGEHRPR